MPKEFAAGTEVSRDTKGKGRLEQQQDPEPEQRRVLPMVSIFDKYNLDSHDITTSHIASAIEYLKGGYNDAKSNRDEASLDPFTHEHSKMMMGLYKQAQKEVENFEPLLRNGEKKHVSDQWRRQVQRSQTDLPDADVATLVVNTIGIPILREKMGRGESILRAPLEMSRGEIDTSKIHPSDYLLECHAHREQKHWERILQLHYNGNFGGHRGEKAIKEFSKQLGMHAQTLIKDAFAFRGVMPRHLMGILNNRDEKLPSVMSPHIDYASFNQAMFGFPVAPIHGYMSNNSDGTLPKRLRVGSYDGLITFRLKKDRVMERATLAFDDIRKHYWEKENEVTIVPRPANQLDGKVWPLAKVSMDISRIRNLRQGERLQDQNPLAIRSIHELDNYVNLHFHDGLTLDDVEKVFLRKELLDRFLKPEEVQRVPVLLNEHGIEWEYI